MSLKTPLPYLCLAAALWACSSDDTTPGAPVGAGGAGGSTTDAAAGSDAAEGDGASGTDAAEDSAPGEDATEESAVVDAAVEAEAAAPVTSCSEIGAEDCFANKDCASEQRCENRGTEEAQVPCCVPGARGTKVAGEACTGELDCESGVCIAGDGPFMCSKDCTTANDCPDKMKDCTPIAFSGSDDSWCFPTE